MLNILLLVAPSLAATLSVSSTGTYTKIQDAINGSSSGDTITVAAGTYTECLNTGGKNLTIQGAGSTTRLTSTSCSTGILRIVGGETVSFSGFRIENSGAVAISISSSFASFDNISVENSGGKATSLPYKYGGGLYATGSYVDISSSTFDDNLADYGGAIAIEGGTVLSLVDVELIDNIGTYSGGAIWAEDDYTVVELDSCTFTTNGTGSLASGKGGAVTINNGVVLTDLGSTFEENYAANYGGALYADNCEVYLEDSVFDANYVDRSFASPISGGAIYAEDLTDFEITGATFTDNVAYLYGGAIHGNSLDTTMIVDSSTFEGNEVQSKRGGAIEVSAGTDLLVMDSVFDSNLAAEAGAAISIYLLTGTADAEIYGSTFEKNKNSSTRDAYGAGIFAYTSSGTLELVVEESTFEDNTAALSGGGIYALGLDAVTITDSVFEGNIASGTTSTSLGNLFGGAVNIDQVTDVVITGSTFCGNTADEAGGLHLTSISSLLFTNNIVVENSATLGNGGNLYFDAVTGEVVNNNVLGGSAAGSGAAAYFDSSTALDVINTIFAYNGSGVYAADSGSASGSLFTYNDWYSNTGYDRSGSFTFSTTSSGNTTSAPGFTSYTKDGNCGNDDYVLASTSALIDAGDSSIKDPDGSRSDIGAYGGPNSPYYDGDGDGYYNRDDCDDDDATVNPGASEVCDGADNDCDGVVDEDPTDGTTYYTDSDGDGYGNTSKSSRLCSAASGYSKTGGDCDDTDSAIYPGATEYCNGDDDDCDGTVDESSAVDVSTFYSDIDGDGYGSTTFTTSACSAPTGYVANSSDCDDSDSAIYPGAPEYCNGDDDDCDGTVDESSAVDASTFYYDADSDGYGVSTFTSKACSVPSGFAATSGDCDDKDSSINPGAAEVCDGDDNDCDGATDEGVTSTFYADSDGDGYGDPATIRSACAVPSGHVVNDDDCDDDAVAVNPAATEVCNSIDDDCDGAIDGPDAADVSTFYADGDGDGFGDAGTSVEACAQPSGHVSNSTDCDDDSSGTYPGADEYCDGADNDCDDVVDEEAVDSTVWYVDADEDGYGNPDEGGQDCTVPGDAVLNGDDCDDAEPDAHPGREELPYDGVDNDCEGGDLTDVDGDGYDAEYVGGLDCDDGDASAYPGASDDPSDGVDSDCDGTVEKVGDDTGNIDGDGSGGKEGCSYVSASSAGVWGLLALVGATLGRRRRR